MELKDWVRAARKQKGWTQTDLGDAVGRSKANIGHWETGKHFPSVDQLAQISIATGYPMPLLGTPQRPEAQVEDAGRPRVTRATPVVGTAKMGDEGYYVELQHPVGHGDGFIDGYSSDPAAYALRVKGDSMHPAIRHGAFVVVEPSGHCMPGEYVAIGLVNGQRMVKELIMERQDEVVIESVNGNHRRTLDRSEVEWMHPVAAVVAASKWRAE